MEKYIPDYYNKFYCIADKCKHNCCIGWEIDIDDETLEYYNSISGDFGIRLKNSITSENETYFFKLQENDRCPFLNKNNLCDIILNLGEQNLCQICTDHPRFINYYDLHTELGLGLTCEAASRLILTHKNKVQLINHATGAKFIPSDNPDDIFNVRQNILDILQDRDFTVDERIEHLITSFNIKMPDKSIPEWRDVYLSLEQLDPDWSKRLNSLTHSPKDNLTSPDWQIGFEQLLVYFIYRHFADCQYDGLFNERLSFCILSYRIIKSLCLISDTSDIDIFFDIARQYSSEIEYSEENIECLLLELQKNN